MGGFHSSPEFNRKARMSRREFAGFLAGWGRPGAAPVHGGDSAAGNGVRGRRAGSCRPTNARPAPGEPAFAMMAS